MPNGIRNWNFGDVEDFLKDRGFKLVNIHGSHYYYSDGINLVHFQYHGNDSSYPPLTMKTIIGTSDIDEAEWRKWANT